MATSNQRPWAARYALQSVMGIVVSFTFASALCGQEVNTSSFASVDQLPLIKTLPDPFLRPNGARVQTPAEWTAQREYLKDLLTHYMYGTRPPRPDASEIHVDRLEQQAVFENQGVEEHYTLTLRRNGREVVGNMWLIRPAGRSPYPVIVKNCYTGFHDGDSSKKGEAAAHDWAAAAEAVRRGYLLCKFKRTDFAGDAPDPNEEQRGVLALYPEYSWGAIAAWAWGQSIVLDILQRLGYADMDKVIATGHSRGGQAAMAAGIFDERFTLVAPSAGGFGSCGTLRIRDPEGARGKIDYVSEVAAKQFPHWFTKRYLDFAGNQDRMPFDGHTMLVLIAPRPFLNTNATEDEYNNGLSMEAGLRAGMVVYDWLGARDLCRIHWRPGTHAQGEEDWKALLDFADEVFFSRPGTSHFDVWRYPEESITIPWTAPDRVDEK